MRRIPRQALSAPTLGFLRKRSEAVAKAADPRTEAARLWDLRDNKAFREVRAILQQMASGLERCMYCEDSAGIAIEHFWPRSTYPHRAFDWLNYLIICTLCNSNKRDLFPLDEDGKPLLLDPTEDEPLEHMALSPATGSLLGLSRKGTLTIEIIDLDRETLVKGRAGAWTALQVLIADYAHLRHTGDSDRAERVKLTVRQYPFAGVFAALLRMAESADADLLIEARCLRALRDFPEICAWA
jgi:uncharacterized protein (TIGR02646 family)